MNKLKLGLFSLKSKTKLQKDIIKVLNSSVYDTFAEESIKFVVQDLKDLDRTSCAREELSHFLKKLESLKSWEDILKLLLISHQTILSESMAFLNEFKMHEFKNIQALSNQTRELKAYVRCSLTNYYFKYLKTYAEHYFAISEALSINDKITETPRIDIKILQNYAELKNLLTLALKMDDILTISVEVIEVPLIKELGKLILNDATAMYNALQAYISAAIPEIFIQDGDTALRLDELYSDLIKLTRKMIDFDQMKQSFNKSNDAQPLHLFKFDPVFNKQEELYINEFRKQHRHQKQKSVSIISPARSETLLVNNNNIQKGSLKLTQSSENSSHSKTQIPFVIQDDLGMPAYDELTNKENKYTSLFRNFDEYSENDQDDLKGISLTCQNSVYKDNRGSKGASFYKITTLLARNSTKGYVSLPTNETAIIL